MSAKKAYVQVRAVYSAGTLKLLDDLVLPEGARVRLSIQSVDDPNQQLGMRFVCSTRFVPANRLDELTGLIEAGGDALRDSEALYDPDSD